MNELERYLRHATAGLLGRERRTVRQELEGNIRLRAQELEASGLEPRAALRQALEELGAPGLVTSGMNRVYTLPRLVRTGLAAALGAVAVTAMLSSQAQEVSVSFRGAYYSWQPQLAFLDANAVQQQLEKAGAKSTIRSDALSVTFPDASGPIRVPFAKPDKPSPTPFVLFDDLVTAAFEAKLPVTLTGWDRVTLAVGRTQLTVGSREQPVAPYYLYGDAVARGLGLKQTPAVPNDQPEVNATGGPGTYILSQLGSNPGCAHDLRLPGEPGTAYALVSRSAISSSADGTRIVTALIDVAATGQNGLARFYLPYAEIRFTTDRAKVGYTPGSLEPERVMIVRLTGKLGSDAFEPVLPQQETSRNVPMTCL